MKTEGAAFPSALCKLNRSCKKRTECTRVGSHHSSHTCAVSKNVLRPLPEQNPYLLSPFTFYFYFRLSPLLFQPLVLLPLYGNAPTPLSSEHILIGLI